MRVLAVVVALAGLCVLAAVAVLGKPPSDEGGVPQRVADAIAEALPEDVCMSASDAAAAISARLDVLAGNDWSIVITEPARANRCVMAGFSISQKSVVLIPVAPPELRSAVKGIADELMGSCHDETAAAALFLSAFDRSGVTNAKVRTDGPRAYPIGHEQQVKAYIAAGCFVYTGSGQGPDGELIYYLSGPET